MAGLAVQQLSKDVASINTRVLCDGFIVVGEELVTQAARCSPPHSGTSCQEGTELFLSQCATLCRDQPMDCPALK